MIQKELCPIRFESTPFSSFRYLPSPTVLRSAGNSGCRQAEGSAAIRVLSV